MCIYIIVYTLYDYIIIIIGKYTTISLYYIVCCIYVYICIHTLYYINISYYNIMYIVYSVLYFGPTLAAGSGSPASPPAAYNNNDILLSLPL